MPRRPPLIGIFVDGVSSYGRGILRGVSEYANLQRRWRLCPELWPADHRLGELPQCDGVILAGQPPRVLDWALKHVDRVINCSGAGDPTQSAVVSIDNHAVGMLAAEHLLECRLEQFAYFGPESHRTASDRLEGFTRGVELRGFRCISCASDLSEGNAYSLHKHRDGVIEWMKGLPKPIGVLAFDDTSAYALAAACMEAGIAVPDRVAIVGVNDDAMICESAWPPLSSVDCGWVRLGHTAGALMERLLANEKLSDSQRLMRIPPIDVTRRQSTSLLAVHDHDLAEAIRFIREHACDPCTVGDVLRQVPIGRRWLERQFFQTLGRTPHDEIMRVRIETAMRFLAKTDLTIVEIALRCGFSRSTNFYGAFRRVHGETPAVYRRLARSAGGPHARPIVAP